MVQNQFEIFTMLRYILSKLYYDKRAKLQKHQTNKQKNKDKTIKQTNKKHARFPRIQEGVKGVNRLATKGEKILQTTDKARKKLPTVDKKVI